MFDYYILRDREHDGTIVKKNRETHEEFYFDWDKREWILIGIMMRYYWPDSPTYGMYDDMTEEEALQAVS